MNSRTSSPPLNPAPARPAPTGAVPAKPAAQGSAQQAERRAVRLAAQQATGLGGF